MRKPLLAAAAAAALVGPLLRAIPAAANGRFPASNQIVFSPTDAKVVFGRTTFALLPSTDNGATWSYLCEGLLALPTVTNYQDPELAFTANGSLVAGLFAPTKGLNVSKDLGCSWACSSTLDGTRQVVDTVVRPNMQHDILALVSDIGVDGGNRTQVYESTDDGATWSALGKPIDPAVLVTTIDVSATDPARIYVSGTRGFGASRTASLFASTDTGQTWNEYSVTGYPGDSPGGGGEISVFIGGVDPTNADQVYLRSNGSALGGTSSLYASSNGGKTIAKVNSFYVEAAGFALVGELLGFAIAPDGSKVFIGTKESGLWSANRSDLVFTSLNNTVGVQCLATRATSGGYELWACGNEYKGPPGNPGNFVFGVSNDQGKTFTAKLQTLTTLKGLAQCPARTDSTPVACGATPEASTCACDEYTNFCSNIESVNACLGCGQTAAGDDGGPTDDAGASDAGGDVDATIVDADGGHLPKTASSSSCGCSLVGLGGTAAPGAVAALAVLAAGLRRRRRRD